MSRNATVPVSPEKINENLIESKIYTFRGKNVMLDSDIAVLYQVETKTLNLAVKRHIFRFPEDFMFQLTQKEFEILRFQSETSRWGGRRYPPYAFTEQGVAMLSSVLNSERAIMVNIQIMRAFTRFRQILKTHIELKYKIKSIEKKLGQHDKEIKIVFDAIRGLLSEPEKPARRMGFTKDK